MYIDKKIDHQMQEVTAFSALSAIAKREPRPLSVELVTVSHALAAKYLSTRTSAGFPKRLTVALRKGE